MANQKRALSLSDLVTEALELTDTDGVVYPVKTLDDFSAVDLVALKRIERIVNESQTKALTVDESKVEQAAQEMVAAFDAFIGLICPSMPAERRAALGIRKQTAIVAWWNAEHEQVADPNRMRTNGA